MPLRFIVRAFLLSTGTWGYTVVPKYMHHLLWRRHHIILCFVSFLCSHVDLSGTLFCKCHTVQGRHTFKQKGKTFSDAKLSATDFAGPKALCFRFLWRGQRHSTRLAIEILATTVVVNAGLYVSPVGRPFRLGGHARGCRQQGEGQNKGHGYYAWHAAPPEVRFSETMGRLRAMLSVVEQKRPKLTGDGG